ncbi:hypothetical protein [Asticcacaulis sp. YBE204]|uniref:hypothetical protein n=1 Tax=Asticcacaulis sp. YBE204 TaxID=1282363 RepID=UPI0003C3C04C|nr:hypothetical protein [Asticcacaulis sp. YBE204]ESQ78186.1 hypothetical protein AEYBE204_15225 [Asticcacaulis sp. YBE204]
MSESDYEYSVQALDIALASADCVKLITDHRDDYSQYEGYVIAVSDKLALLQIIDDWHTDGFAVFALSHLAGWRQSPTETGRSTILRALGFHKSVQPDGLNFDSLPELCWALKAMEKTIAVHISDGCEVGEIAHVSRRLILNGIDAVAAPIEGPVEIDWEDISQISFDDEYTTGLKTYVQSLKS